MSEWTEKYRFLTFPAEEKGPLRLSRTPYLRPVLDCCTDPNVEEVVVCKPAQYGGSEAFISIIGYFAIREPCPIMYVLADEDTSIYMARERLHKLFQADQFKAYIRPDVFGQKEIALTNGSYIAMAWASSVSKLASRPMRILVLDEIDKPGYSMTSKEGSSISLAVQRTESFYNRKIFYLSTPTLHNGNIIKQLESCDIIYDWHVPCLYCGQLQPLRWSREFTYGFEDNKYRAEDGSIHEIGQVSWEGGRDADRKQISNAGYKCGECGEVWTTVQKNLAVEKGRSIGRQEIDFKPRKIGFHDNRLVSLLGKSGDIPRLVENWLNSFKDPLERQGFVNSSLAEPWRQTISSVTGINILKARCALSPQTVPSQAVALTCGVDVQMYGFWFVVRAWAQDFTSWNIHCGNLPTWHDVESLLFGKSYPVEGSKDVLGIWRAGVDIGGTSKHHGISMTEETELWLMDNGRGRGCRVWGTKGAATTLKSVLKAGKPLIQTPSGKPLRGGLQIISLDSDKLKDMYHYHLDLAIEEQPRGAYLHVGMDEVYADQILAEEKQVDRKTGKETWVQTKKDNHLLDAETIAFACAHWEWPGGGVNLMGATGDSNNKRIKPVAARSRRNRW